jgi:hypothetical protein
MLLLFKLEFFPVMFQILHLYRAGEAIDGAFAFAGFTNPALITKIITGAGYFLFTYATFFSV